MRSASRGSLAAATDRLEPVLAADADATGIGEELFAVGDLLTSATTLRRALTDPARSGSDRAGLARRLLLGKARATVVDVVAGLAGDRWSADADLVDALEHLGTEAVLADAGYARALDTVEDELFRFSRVVAGNAELQRALDDRGAPVAARTALVERLLAGRATPATLVLVRRAVSVPRRTRIEPALASLLEAAAARRSRVVAFVTAAAPLTDAQTERLAAALGRVYGRRVLVEVAVDADLVGGLRVQLGDEVIDATTASRLAQLRARVAG